MSGQKYSKKLIILVRGTGKGTGTVEFCRSRLRTVRYVMCAWIRTGCWLCGRRMTKNIVLFNFYFHARVQLI